MEKQEQKIEQNLKHVGIIMDGNRRWAKERNLSTHDGHLKGYEKVKEIPEMFFKRGVEIVSLFAFSTENWKRSSDEVNYLMKLLKRAIEENVEDFVERDVRVLVSGRIEELPGDLPELCYDIIARTKDAQYGTLNICVNYGGRTEIIDAFKKMIKNNIELDQAHEGMIRKYLYNGGIADPDMIVRTSGELRTSGFMLWQSAYAELFFMQKYWPDFEESDVEKIIDEYNNRKRRFGGDS